MRGSRASASAEGAAAGGLPAGAVVAIVGRPNVGKSALFNRILGNRTALVEDVPGTTRDRLYGDVTWGDAHFRLVDTGGLEPEASEGYPALVRRQVEVAVEEASVVLFVVDAKEGLTAADLEVADVLRRCSKPTLLLANKAETGERREATIQFYELGLGEPVPISAYHGVGVADVMDMVVAALPPAAEAGVGEEALGVAIVGRPNVGKSMLLNAVLGEERVIVSEEPGTTRDAIDTAFEFRGEPLVLVDTAGLRRRGHIRRGVEKHATLRARGALERAGVVLAVFDAREGFTAQDVHVAGYAIEAYRGLVLVANKWDLMGDTSRAEFERQVRRRLRFAPWAALAIVSAKEGSGIGEMLAEVVRVGGERKRRVETGRLNSVLRGAVAERPPPTVRGRRPKLLYVTQPEVSPPTFVLFVSDASALHFSYRRYIENAIRGAFGFEGTALRLVFRGRREG
jgi:GTP-binding protein